MADDSSQIDLDTERADRPERSGGEREKKEKRDSTSKDSNDSKKLPGTSERENKEKKDTLAAVRKTNAILEALVDSESSSSEDQPLSQCSKNIKEATGTKRKAEVLSKESGKIGVTIKTSPDGPPAAKIHCGESATPISAPLKTEPAPLSPETPASHPESNTPAEKPIAERGNNENVVHNNVANNPNADAAQAEEANLNNDALNADAPIVANNNNGNKAIQTSPRSVPPTLWLPKARNTDQVFITDVTVNLETVTIRECKTERGFFRERTVT